MPVPPSPAPLPPAPPVADNSTVTLVQVIYREAFQRQNLGTAAALSIIVMAVLVLLNAIQLRFLRGADRD